MDATSGKTWKKFGRRSVFAIEYCFHDVEESWQSLSAESYGWGSYRIWVRGKNLCQHSVDSVDYDAITCSLFPVFEWLEKGSDNSRAYSFFNTAYSTVMAFYGFISIKYDSIAGKGTEQTHQDLLVLDKKLSSWFNCGSLVHATKSRATHPALFIYTIGDDSDYDVEIRVVNQIFNVSFDMFKYVSTESRFSNVAQVQDPINQTIESMRYDLWKQGNWRSLRGENLYKLKSLITELQSLTNQHKATPDDKKCKALYVVVDELSECVGNF